MSRLRARLSRGDRGATLVELLVASSLFVGLSGIVLGAAVSASTTAQSQREVNDLNEEARILMNRLSRELREAEEIRAVTNPVGAGHDPTADSSITFWVDLDGNGSDVVASGGEPEVFTYLYDADGNSGRVLLQVPGQTEPVLAGHVTRFALSFTSSSYLYDGSLDGVKDGTVTWEELDSYPTGSAAGNGNRVLDTELATVDAVNVDFAVFQEPRTQSYRTQVALRNAR